MIKDDADDFKVLLESTMSIYNAETNVNVLRIWWMALSRFDFEKVKSAFSRHIQDAKNGKFAPKPADIIGIIESFEADDRVGAEEAWALYPHDELSSAVITDEISEAMSVAQVLLNEGDKIGARMAFKEAYTRITSRNKLNGIKPKWFASLGTDKQCRESALKQAVTQGRLPQSQADKLLPVTYDQNITQAIGQMKMITSKDEKLTDEEKEKAKAKLNEIRKLLTKKMDYSHDAI